MPNRPDDLVVSVEPRNRAGATLSGRAGGLRPEPAAQSQPEALIPSAEVFIPCPQCGGNVVHESRCEWQHYDWGSIDCAVCGASIVVDEEMRSAMSSAKTQGITARNMQSKPDEMRDMFAAHIAGGILAGGWADTVPLDDCTHAEQLAAFAYAGANAMLIERKAYLVADAELRAALTPLKEGEVEVTQSDINALADICDALGNRAAAKIIRRAGLCGTVHHTIAAILARHRNSPQCTIPPLGWFCTRDAGHEGPCAAYAQGTSGSAHDPKGHGPVRQDAPDTDRNPHQEDTSHDTD